MILKIDIIYRIEYFTMKFYDSLFLLYERYGYAIL